jgi:uncharacterized protein (TIGR03435 family)
MVNSHPFVLNVGRTTLLVSVFLTVGPITSFAQIGDTPVTTSTAEENAAVGGDSAFDVVSIRPSNGGRPRHIQVTPGGDQYASIGMPLGWTILMAYFPFRTGSKDRFVGAPDWVWNDLYDVVGKVGEADLPAFKKFSQRGFSVENRMLQIMLQNALADRCRMAVHRVPALIDGYALVVANHGPNRKNLVESKPDDPVPDRAQNIELDAKMVPIYSHDDPVLHFYQTSMAAFVLQMTHSVPIEDRTGLSGRYRFDLTRLGTEGIPTSDWDLAPLGLKLIPVKIPAQNIVIDHIERPSPN